MTDDFDAADAAFGKVKPGAIVATPDDFATADSAFSGGRSVGASKADQIPGQIMASGKYIPATNPAVVAHPEPSLLEKYVTGPISAATSAATGIIGQGVGTVYGIAKEVASGKFGTPEGTQLANDEAIKMANQIAEKPHSQAAADYLGWLGSAFDDSKLGGLGPAEFFGISGTIPSVQEAAAGGKLLFNAGKPAALVGDAATAGSVGAAGVLPAEMAKATVANASPELQSAVNTAIQKGQPLNAEVLSRHAEADSLPVPVRLTAGQATQDPVILSQEQNMRGAQPALAQRFNEQNGQMIGNVNAIRESAAPDIYTSSKPELGSQIINGYETKDAALKADISAKYKALEDANGGQFPLDGKAFVDNADTALHKALLYNEVPAGLRSTLNDLRQGGSMTFEDFESLRTNLARTMRSQSADGNVKAAAGVIRDALEEMPMPAGAEHLKPLADTARAAAKARFDLIGADPAYKAVVNGTASPDAFVGKYVVGGDLGDVQTMKVNLSHDPVAQQAMTAGTLDFLKERAGILDNQGNFSQSGFNRGLEKIRPKLSIIFEPETANQVQTLGNVARYTQAQPRGSFVNNSNTLTALLSSGAKSAAEGATNVAFKGVPVGTWTRTILGNRATAKTVNQSLKPGAGILLKDIR